MLRRGALFVVPAIATAIVALVLLGPGRTREIHAVRLMVTDAAPRSLRLISHVRRELGDSPVALSDLSLWVEGESSPRWSGNTNERGVAELVLSDPLPAGSKLRIVRAAEILAEGEIGVDSTAVAKRRDVRVGHLTQNGLELSVTIERGVLVASFKDRLLISLKQGDAGASCPIKVSAISAEPADAALTPGPDGSAALELTPLAQPVQLSLTASCPGRTLEGEVVIPVAMSGLFLSPVVVDGQLEVVSPGPRKAAFLSFHPASGRSGGATIELHEDERGFFRGTAPLDLPRDLEAVVASGELSETGPSTVVWPAPGTRGTATAPTLVTALDGMAQAAARERKRAAGYRMIAVVALSIAALLEIALLLWAGRTDKRERQRLAALVRDALPGDEAMTEGDGEGAFDPHQRQTLVAIMALVVLSALAVVLLVIR